MCRAWGNQFLWGYKEEQDPELQQVFNLVVSRGINFFDTGQGPAALATPSAHAPPPMSTAPRRTCRPRRRLLRHGAAQRAQRTAAGEEVTHTAGLGPCRPPEAPSRHLPAPCPQCVSFLCASAPSPPTAGPVLRRVPGQRPRALRGAHWHQAGGLPLARAARKHGGGGKGVAAAPGRAPAHAGPAALVLRQLWCATLRRGTACARTCSGTRVPSLAPYALAPTPQQHDALLAPSSPVRSRACGPSALPHCSPIHSRPLPSPWAPSNHPVPPPQAPAGPLLPPLLLPPQRRCRSWRSARGWRTWPTRGWCAAWASATTAPGSWARCTATWRGAACSWPPHRCVGLAPTQVVVVGGGLDTWLLGPGTGCGRAKAPCSGEQAAASTC